MPKSRRCQAGTRRGVPQAIGGFFDSASESYRPFSATTDGRTQWLGSNRHSLRARGEAPTPPSRRAFSRLERSAQPPVPPSTCASWAKRSTPGPAEHFRVESEAPNLWPRPPRSAEDLPPACGGGLACDQAGKAALLGHQARGCSNPVVPGGGTALRFFERWSRPAWIRRLATAAEAGALPPSAFFCFFFWRSKKRSPPEGDQIKRATPVETVRRLSSNLLLAFPQRARLTQSSDHHREKGRRTDRSRRPETHRCQYSTAQPASMAPSRTRVSLRLPLPSPGIPACGPKQPQSTSRPRCTA